MADTLSMTLQPVHLWQGEMDRNAPPAMGRYLAAAIPQCRATFYPNEGHVSLIVNHAAEILRVLAVGRGADDGWVPNTCTTSTWSGIPTTINDRGEWQCWQHARLVETTCLATQQPVLAHDQVPIDKKEKITTKKEKIASTMAATTDKKEKIASTMAATVYSIRSNGVTFGPTLLVTCGLANTTFLRLAAKRFRARFRTATTLAMLPPPSVAGTVRL